MGRMNRDNQNNYGRETFSRDDNNFDRTFDAREYSQDDNRGFERRNNTSNYDERDNMNPRTYNNAPIQRDDFRNDPINSRNGAPNSRNANSRSAEDNYRHNDGYNANTKPRYEDNRSNGYYPDDDNSYINEARQSRQTRPSNNTNPHSDYDRKAEDVRRFQESNKGGIGSDVTICAPKSYSDVQNLIVTLRNNQSLIVDTDKIDPKDMQRYLDFLSGAIYALGGSHQKIGKSLMLFTPAGSCITVPCDIKG